MAAGATFWTLDFEGFGEAFAEANFGSVGAFGDKNVKNSWPYTQFWVDITNKMSNQAHICSFSNRLKMKRTWIKQWHAALWRNPGAGMMSSARGFGGLAARCPLPNSPAWGQDTGHGGPRSLWWDTSLRHALPLPWPPERPASQTCLLCPRHHISQQALSPIPQRERASSFKKSKDHTDVCWRLWSKDLMFQSLLGRHVPISLLSVMKSDIFTPFWDVLYISFHMCALTCLWKSKYNFIKFFAWVRS